MDIPTKFAFVALGMIAAGTVWWYLRDELRQHRRARAEVWARQQMSPDEPPIQQRLDDDTAPLDLPPTEAFVDSPPELVRAYLWMREQTEVLPRITDSQ